MQRIDAELEAERQQHVVHNEQSVIWRRSINALLQHSMQSLQRLHWHTGANQRVEIVRSGRRSGRRRGRRRSDQETHLEHSPSLSRRI
jgi:hypothetical protein